MTRRRGKRRRDYHKAANRQLSYAELAQDAELRQDICADGPVRCRLDAGQPAGRCWERRCLGRIGGISLPARIAMPSDIVRPGMLYGKVLRPPSYGATLKSIDLAPAKAMAGVVVVHEGAFVGCAAPTSRSAEQALAAIARRPPGRPCQHVSSKHLYSYLKEHAQPGRGGGKRLGNRRGRCSQPRRASAAGAETVLQHDYDGRLHPARADGDPLGCHRRI